MAWLPRAIVLLSLAGTGVSGYLLSFRLAEKPVLCFTGGGCEQVNASAYSTLFGLPVSAYGLGLYLLLVILGVLWARRPGAAGEGLRLAVFGLALVGFLFSGYLTAVEAFILHAYCTWCLTSFGIIAAVMVLAALGLRQSRGEGGE